MSTESGQENSTSGFPELSELGMHIEMLRLGRGLSKQYLARQAGTSRQQLWRVMTGKSELTSSLRQRLADALQVDGNLLGTDRLLKTAGAHTSFEMGLASGQSAVGSVSRMAASAPPDQTRTRPSRTARGGITRIDRYLDDCAAIERTLSTLPDGPAGRRIKRSLLNALEEVATEHGVRLCAEFFELRGRVVNDEV